LAVGVAPDYDPSTAPLETWSWAWAGSVFSLGDCGVKRIEAGQQSR